MCVCVRSFTQKYAWIYLKFLSKLALGPISRRFHLQVIRITVNLHCHLEVTVAKQGHFGLKSTVAQKRKEIRPELP